MSRRGRAMLALGTFAAVVRTTADLDLAIQLTTDNVLRAMRSLADLGCRPRAPVSIEQLTDPAARESWVRDEGLTVFGPWSDRMPGLEVDVFVEEPFAFDDAYDRGVSVALDTTTATVVSLPDLVALKRASGRAMDLADLEALEALAAEDGE